MVPKNLRYAETHEWVKVEGDVATIGITSFAVEQLTDVVFVDLKPKVGDAVRAGETFGEIESVKAVSDLYAPVSGVVTAINKELTADPAMIGREILVEEDASPNYRMREVQQRRTKEVTWEVIDGASGLAVATGLANREEALRIVRGWERLSQKLEGGLEGHVLVH